MDSTYNLNGGLKPTVKRFADLDGPDFYPTPTWATRALIDNESFEGRIWEPACGDGTMACVLAETGRPIDATDLYDRGFGESGIDFLRSSRTAENIVTNPPFNSAEGFVQAGLRQATRKLCLLLRLAFLEGANRQKTIFTKNPPARVWVFSERITFYPAGAEVKGSGTTAYAWFIWDKQTGGRATELKWLPLGYKIRHLASAKLEAEASRKPMLLK
ncbi:hypothetical protein ACFQY5_35280 [Paeniroseomonas aquatica]|uniref:Methyltransferase n=1 Tax=Paeniroseomonas aquatica TaxID=373043 RepID=A0ABT8A545_9PROT|nr:hypothetical protein [Paeniroseomonas aquatica]MDN3564879.1 hypothetical protein [Paeniroseomonas aquatica]